MCCIAPSPFLTWLAFRHSNKSTTGFLKQLPIQRDVAAPIRADELTCGGREARANFKAEEQSLVDRCRNGDEAAWAEMHKRCHECLIKQIRYSLGTFGRDSNLVEEIAARVWFGLVADDGHLLARFQPDKGNGLEKYLAAIARYEVLRHQRSEFRRRRRERETQAMRGSNRDDRELREMALDVKGFLPQLTPREREFFDHVLIGNNGHHLQISAPNAWQLRHRIRKKLVEFLQSRE